MQEANPQQLAVLASIQASKQRIEGIILLCEVYFAAFTQAVALCILY